MAAVTVLFMTVLLGLAAMVLDVGSWYRADRALQARADAAVLAGAQALPWDGGQAAALALEYADKNGGGIDAGEISVAGDTIAVNATHPAPGFFSKIVGLDSVTVRAQAKARALYLAKPRYVAPIAVDEKHPMLQCSPPPCLDETDLPLFHLHRPGSGTAAGSFGLINLSGQSGEVQAYTLGDWILHGWDGYLDVGWYRSVPSAKFNSIEIRSALDQRIGDVLMFPVWRSIVGDGENAKFDVIGWVGFELSGYTIHGSVGMIHGHFTHVVWEGIQSETAPPNPDFGVRSISLIE